MKRKFKDWLSTMKDSIATWTYYTDFEKAYENVESLKIELNILNSLIGTQDIERKFKDLITRYPEIIKAIPILLAKRDTDIKVNEPGHTYVFNFVKMNYSVDQYALFMKNSGLFELLQKHIINNLVDYVLGVEVGMDTNGRKNRTGHLMEDLVESYLLSAGLVKDKTYFKEMYLSEVEEKFKVNLQNLSNQDKTEKRFDYVFVGAMNEIYLCECNFYSSSGSKLNETARSYKLLSEETKQIKGVKFVWFTDGQGWFSAKHNLEETFDVLDDLYNINDLENGAIDNLVNSDKYMDKVLKNY